MNQIQPRILNQSDDMGSRHQDQILESRKYFNKLTSQKEVYTIEEAKEIIKKVLKKFYDSL